MDGTPYPLLSRIMKTSLLNEETYHSEYQRSIADPAAFWSDQAKKHITWFSPWKKVLTGDFKKYNVLWFQGAKLNAAYNCLDRHLETRGKQTAIIWESDDPNFSQTLTYEDLYVSVCRLANVLKSFGIKKGDVVCIYLPMIPEAAISMLACARIGAIHSVVFGGFSAEALKSRILDANAKCVITANVGIRGHKIIPLKSHVDIALKDNSDVTNVIVVKRTEEQTPWLGDRDVWYHEAISAVKVECDAVEMAAEDPLFILYTSGSTGQPKGILHGHGGYLVYAAMTHQYIFDYHDGDIYWCTADIGWITGHSYGVYGPLLNGATTLMFEGVPNYPTPSRFWEVVDKHKVNIFYTAPTAIRALRREGDEWVTKTNRQSLRILGSVGEPINPEAWEWYYHVVGDDRCAVVDTWWQTETGGIMISPLPGATPLKPWSAAWPFFGILPHIVNEQGKRLPPNEMGQLVIKNPWPGMMQTIYRDHQRFIETYFKEFPGYYSTGDQAYSDEEGYYWVLGRSDDVIKVSGHRIGTGEVEGALITHVAVSETAVIGVPHSIKGQSIYAFVTLRKGHQASDELKKELIQKVRDNIGAIAIPETIQWANELPKTRSGKIMRRILRKIATQETKNLGDLSTLANPDVVNDLIKNGIT
jgi:acetyl-CoA synthetase